MRRFILALLLLTAPLLAQKKPLSVDALYDPKTMTRFNGAIQSGFDWIDDAAFIWPRTDPAGDVVEWRLFDTATGKERPLFDPKKLQKALTDAGLTIDDAKDALKSKDLTFDAKKSAVLFSIADDLYLFSFARNAATRLTSAPGEEEQAAFSPDGRKVAFVRANDLYVVDLDGRERRLTTDGSAQILNGKLDWVYQEEVYGRGTFKGYWWSPDSTRIAFLRLDESPVPRHVIIDHIPYHLDVDTYPYPKAGDPNPRASLHLVPASGGSVVSIDNDRYSSGEFLIVNVAWAPDAKTLTYQVQNREQTWLDLVSATPDGETEMLIHETTKAWVEPLASPVWLSDGSFLWQSERTGFRHLYRYNADGQAYRPITKGDWEVREVHGTDGHYVYFSGTERTSFGLDVYRIKLDGSDLQRLSSEEGTHTALFNPSLALYVDKWSDVRTPDQIRVHRNDGKVLHVVETNPVSALSEYDLPKAEFLQVKARDGVALDAVMFRPANFDPSRKYPVFQLLYGGPHAPKVLNKWMGQGMQSYLFLQLIAQQGAIAWVVDNRTASGKGAVSAWPIYKNLGESELRDFEDAIRWLKAQPYVDGNRVALFGWSYGGFMVSYALTHSTEFSAGIAGGTVADWRDYDSIYTERVMLMPQNNPEGYRKSSPRFAAKDLHGDLLLLHGLTDDNVHLQNTVQFMQELQQSGKIFQLMLFPRTRHGVTDPTTLLAAQRTILEFLKGRILATPSQK